MRKEVEEVEFMSPRITLMGPRDLYIFGLKLDKEYREQLVQEAYKHVGVHDYETNVKSRMSSWHIHADSGKFDKFLEKAREAASLCDWMYCPNDTDDKFGVVLDDLWAAIYQKGDYSIRHHHGPSYYSFVYYLKTGNANTPLVFDELNYSYTPVENEIIFFPSDVMHHVPVHDGDEDRVVIAGNLTNAVVK